MHEDDLKNQLTIARNEINNLRYIKNTKSLKLLKFKFNVIYIPASITCVQHQAASAQLAACAAQGHRNNQPAAAGLSLRRLRQQQEHQEQGHRQGQIGNGSPAAGT